VPRTIYLIDPSSGYEVAMLAISIMLFWTIGRGNQLSGCVSWKRVAFCESFGESSN
jgi:hypothetical protein